jgi:hypothetical protein
VEPVAVVLELTHFSTHWQPLEQLTQVAVVVVVLERTQKIMAVKLVGLELLF